MKIKHIYLFFVLLSAIGFLSCSDMNDIHDGYLQRGETIYVGQPDSAKTFSGNGRVLLRYWYSDPKVAKLKVFWDFRQDSLLLDIPEGQLGKPIDLLIDKLEEKQYTFELVTFNKTMQYPSIPLKIQANVYGENFQSTLFDRKVRYATYIDENHIKINWGSKVINSIGIDIAYVDNEGIDREEFIPIDKLSTELNDFSEDLTYRTVFLPDSAAVDTFYTSYKTIPIDKEVNKGTFKRWNPTGIPYNDLGSSYTIEKMWNNDVNTWYIFNIPQGYPHSLTFDLGKLFQLTRIKHWQRLTNSVVYRIQNVKTFVLYGSSTDKVGAGYDGWTKLGAFQSYKPSGLPKGQESAEDVEYATQGEVFILDKNIPPVHYIRYEVIETWDNKVHGAIGEMSFFSID